MSEPYVPVTTTPCATTTAGSLTSGNSQCTASYSYDNLDRLTSGPAGATYTYGDAAHLHAATVTSGGYSAAYDAAGNMTCRAPTSATTCTGSSPTGQILSYDNEGQLVGWRASSVQTPPPNTASFAYDGEGSRVAQQTNTATGITTTTDYLLGGLEEQQSVGGSVRPSSTLTEYYPLPGIGTAVRVITSSSSTISYLAGDQLGSVSVALSTSGTVTAQALYSPYGTLRYSSGTMPTAHGYTGQLADAMTGLDYYGARYYDPALGQFTQAGSVLDGGLNRYAYVGDSPCTYNDPSGHCKMPRRSSVDGFFQLLGVAWQLAWYILFGHRGPYSVPRGYPAPPSGYSAQAPDNTPAVPTPDPADNPSFTAAGPGNYGGGEDNNPTADVLKAVAKHSDSSPGGGCDPRLERGRWYDVRRWIRGYNGRPVGRYQPVGQPLPVSYPQPVASPLPGPAPYQPVTVPGTPPDSVLRDYVPSPGTPFTPPIGSLAPRGVPQRIWNLEQTPWWADGILLAAAVGEAIYLQWYATHPIPIGGGASGATYGSEGAGGGDIPLIAGERGGGGSHTFL